jgi:lactose/L-arabinose transport system permease protein
MRARRNWADVRRHAHFYLFIAPFFLLFAVFGMYPVLFSFFLSFTKWNGLTERRWIGLANFAAMLHDEIFWTSLWNTAVLGVLTIPAMLVLGFLFALGLNAGWLRAKGYLRTAFFLPCITPMVAIAIVFLLVYSPERGILNWLLRSAGLGPLDWLNSVSWSKPSLAMVSLWRWTGYTAVLMLAGLQGIPKDYYEAARLDGAGGFARMWHITLPLMRPMFIYCSISALLGTVFMFDEVIVLTEGGPGASSLNFGLYLFNTSFVDFRFGYASAVAYTMAAFVFLLSLVIVRRRRGDENW